MIKCYQKKENLSRKRIDSLLYRYKELKDDNSFNLVYGYLSIRINQLIKKVFGSDLSEEYFLDLRQECFEKIIFSINKFKFKKDNFWFKTKNEFIKYCRDNGLPFKPDVDILDYCLLQVYNCLKDLRRKYFRQLRYKKLVLEKLFNSFKKKYYNNDNETKIDIDLCIDKQDNIRNKDIVANIISLAIEGNKNHVIKSILKLWNFNNKMILKCFSFLKHNFLLHMTNKPCIVNMMIIKKE